MLVSCWSLMALILFEITAAIQVTWQSDPVTVRTARP
jgi:hypothetical protein